MTLIGLIDRIRMLDNDLIRIKTKLDMILEQQENAKKRANGIINTDANSKSDDSAGGV